MEKVDKLFRLIDIDDSKTIDRDETLKFWSSNFAKINSSVLFDQVDKITMVQFNMMNGQNFGKSYMIQVIPKKKFVLNQKI